MTVLLTTHYLEEADDCDQVAFLSTGRIVLSGDPRTLIDQLGRYIVEIESDHAEQLAEQLAPRLGPALIEADLVQFRCSKEPTELVALQAELAVSARAVRWRRPNLNDVFLWVNQTGMSRKRAA